MLQVGTRYALPLCAVSTALAYYLGAQLGMAFASPTDPISPIWPPNAILLGVLLCTPVGWWPAMVLAALPAHLAVELNGAPLLLVFSWFVSNCSQALIGAVCIRRFIAPPVRFDNVRRVLVFVAFGAVLSPFVASFLDVGFVTWNNWAFGQSYVNLWRVRFFSNVLAVLTFVPIIVPWDIEALSVMRASNARRRLEAAGLAAGLISLPLIAFLWHPPAALAAPLLLSIALPCLLWAAVRFGPRGASMSLLSVNFLLIIRVMHGRGLFAAGPLRENILALQLFLIGVSIPIMVLAAVIRERTRAESKRRRHEEWLHTVLGAAQMGTWSLDLATRAMRLSRRSRELFGFAALPTNGRDNHAARLTADERDVFLSVAGNTGEESAPHVGEFRLVGPHGLTRWILSKGDVIHDGNGQPVRVVGVHADITDRKLAEAELREEIETRARVERALRASEERRAIAFRTSPDAIAVVRRIDGHFIEVNEHWTALFGYEVHEAVGRTRDELGICLHGAECAQLDELLELQGYVRDFEIDVRNKAGQILRVVVACETVDVGPEACFIILMRDVTEPRRAEREIESQRRQLAHLSRVSLLGELSGAVAHELNQPLAAILANTRAAQRMLAHDVLDREELRAILEDIAADDSRAGEVIRRLRRMLQKGDNDPQQVVMNDVIDEMLALAHSEVVQRGVAITTHFAPSLPPVAADRVQLQQVMLNLIVNACDAMSENPPNDRRIVITTADVGSAVRLSISDRGTGIMTQPIDSVFDQFVSSKRNGLGLGLSICRSIVNAHGGRLWAENNADRGATFHLLLPRTQFTLHVPPLAHRQEKRVAAGSSR